MVGNHGLYNALDLIMHCIMCRRERTTDHLLKVLAVNAVGYASDEWKHLVADAQTKRDLHLTPLMAHFHPAQHSADDPHASPGWKQQVRL